MFYPCIIIGAGLAGLTAAKILREKGFHPVILEKARGVGGRMATRRVDGNLTDHGAQYFTITHPEFQALVDEYTPLANIYPWSNTLIRDSHFTADDKLRYVSRLGMTALPKAIAKEANLEIHTQAKVTAIQKTEGPDAHWTLTLENGQSYTTSTLLITAPVPQAIQLLSNVSELLPDIKLLQTLEYHPCLASLITFNAPQSIPGCGGIQLSQGLISWIANNQQKMSDNQTCTWTVHGSSTFSRQYFDAPDDKILSALKPSLAEYADTGQIQDHQVQRWRYSQPTSTHSAPYACLSKNPNLFIAGDAFGGPKVEGAFLSGVHVAKAMRELLQARAATIERSV
ncbi:MAG: FAD-dependent oxidoreductase [Vampirovibrio sp.]|nr:FAD-dependent oxidoreductase [Vampirovibrio sp.]